MFLSDDGEEMEIISQSDWFQKIGKKTTAGDVVKIYRENARLSQEQLGEKIGKTRHFVSDLETERRGVSVTIAKKLSALFGVSIERLL